ncbi:hypothetical protein [Kutzneria sp. NPDC052558]|uniref:hypothetical protein n=1 Tax=Kutzneria sp. NPDC052558 TaxID=3364121 RepID=UPI0037C96566
MLGVDHGTPVDAVAKVLGRHWENRNGSGMWRDYGLVEFFYEPRSRGRGWWGTHFSVQTHRLGYGRARDRRSTVGAAVVERYGRKYRKALSFEALKGELTRRGVELVEVDDGPPYVREYWQRESETSVWVDADEEIGRVLKITSNRAARPKSVSKERMRALLEMSEAERDRWLGRGHESELTGIWSHARGSTWAHGQRRRAEWVGLYRWAMTRSRELQLVTAAEEARATAGLVSTVADWFPDEFEDLASVLPSADEVARACLAEIAVREPLRHGDKRLVDAATRLADWVWDPELRRELGQWAILRSVPSIV